MNNFMRIVVQFTRKFFRGNTFLLLVCLSIGIGVSVCNKNEMDWDFMNYHYYNPFAFIHNRLNFDIVPSSVNTFFNPLADLPLYFEIEYLNDMPVLIDALQGIWAGLLLWILVRIAMLLFDTDKVAGRAVLIVSMVVAVTGQGTFYQIGTSTNEIPMAFLILSGFYLLLKSVSDPKIQKPRVFLIAGLLMGIALGLKPTVITYCVAAGLTMIVNYRLFNKPLQSIMLFAIAGLVGYLLVNGWFMWKLWSLYGNPFFPFMNGIFRSEYFDAYNYRDARFVPDLKTFLYYPYVWYFKPHRICEAPLGDIRLSVWYTLILGTFAYYIYHRVRRTITPHAVKNNQTASFFFIFLTLSFWVWMGVFSILRYAVVVECLGALWAGYLFIVFLPKSPIRKSIFIGLGILLAEILIAYIDDAYSYGKHKDSKRYIDIESVNLPKNTLVKFYNFPSAGVIPIWSKNNTFRALGYQQKTCDFMTGSDMAERGKFRQMRDLIVSEHTGPVVIVYYDMFPDLRQTPQEREAFLAQCQHLKNIGKVDADFDCSAPVCKPYFEVYGALRAEIGDRYFCRPLKNNINENFYICVPNELKTQILGEE